jgi:hypothetical protein
VAASASAVPERTGGYAALTGYLHADYAASMAGHGRPRLLPRSRGWILERLIPGAGDRDAMGCYPLFCCVDWSALTDDLAGMEGQLVSLALVTDPFGGFDPLTLQRSFPDLCRPFKEHQVVDLARPVLDRLSEHHARNVRRSRRLVEAEVCETPSRHLDEWTALYATLIERHGIDGVAAFSRRSFEIQLSVPGIVAFRATEGGATVGMLLWYVQGEVAFYHLGAYSPRGYELRASYALFAKALEHFREVVGLRHASLGAGAGLRDSADDGLLRFKRGWATATRAAYLCGRILDRRRYDELPRFGGTDDATYFPAYRRGEFMEPASTAEETPRWTED